MPGNAFHQIRAGRSFGQINLCLETEREREKEGSRRIGKMGEWKRKSLWEEMTLKKEVWMELCGLFLSFRFFESKEVVNSFELFLSNI